MTGEKLSPTEYAAQIQEWARGTALGAHSTKFVSAGAGRARAELTRFPTGRDTIYSAVAAERYLVRP